MNKKVEELELVAESPNTGEKVVFGMEDLRGWDDESIFLDTTIYLHKLKEVNWHIIGDRDSMHRLNPIYNIHLKTEEESNLIEPLRLKSIELYPQYCYKAEFSNGVTRTGKLHSKEGTYFYCSEEELLNAKMTPRGIIVNDECALLTRQLWEYANVYVHYGCSAKEFSGENFKEVKNILYFNKPQGGLWASPTKAIYDYIENRKIKSYGWKEFCEDNNFRTESGIDKQFYFCLKPDSNVYSIKSKEDFENLPKTNIIEGIDYEECIRLGIDAIEYNYTYAHKEESLGDRLDFIMLGWDCDSIVILNPDIMMKESFIDEVD